MAKFIMMIVTVVITSCYYFPFVPLNYPWVNSKMILALISLFVIAYRVPKRQDGNIDKGLLYLTLWALAVSIIAFFSTTINNTPNFAYSTYFMSMWVWLGGAYMTVLLIKQTHKKANVELVVNYFLTVCVLQCVLALLFDSNTAAEDWYRGVFGGEAYMGATDERMHGIGCALDVAGFRMAAVLTMGCYMAAEANRRGNSWLVLIYFMAIGFVFVVGDMIARSTMIGLIVGGAYILFIFLFRRDGKGFPLLGKIMVILMVTIPFVVYLYNTDAAVHDNLRFGFEGFFNWYETGKWETNSNNILKDMVVWPDNTKTWLIGDGYMDNPMTDPYYIGPKYRGFYMGTDIGYCRFIFYFGLLGLFTFSAYFIYVTKLCIQQSPNYRVLFLLLLILNFIEWVKVSTDIFVVFAPFLCLGYFQNQQTEPAPNPNPSISA